MNSDSTLKMEKQLFDIKPYERSLDQYPDLMVDNMGLYFVTAGYAEIHSGFIIIFEFENKPYYMEYHTEYHDASYRGYEDFYYGKDTRESKTAQEQIVLMRDAIINTVQENLQAELGQKISLSSLLGNDRMEELFKYYSRITDLDDKTG